MKKTTLCLILILSPWSPAGVHADPCRRLLDEAHALDFKKSSVRYDLQEFGHLKVSTPLVIDLKELKTIFATKPIFNAGYFYGRSGSIVFRQADEWALDTKYHPFLTEAEAAVPELKQLGLIVGQKFEAFLRSQLPDRKSAIRESSPPVGVCRH